MAVPADIGQWGVGTPDRAGSGDMARPGSSWWEAPAGPGTSRTAAGDPRTASRFRRVGIPAQGGPGGSRSARLHARSDARATPFAASGPVAGGAIVEGAAQVLMARARALWPGLPARQLRATRGDPGRIVRLVARQSNEAPEILMRMLLGTDPASAGG